MDLSGFDAIIFDNDGVLVDSEVIHIAAELELLAEIGLDYDHQTYMSRFVGLNNHDFQAALARDYAARYGRTFPPDFRTRLDARAWPRIEAELVPIDGVAELVTAFDGAVAVASSATIPRLDRKLELTGLRDLFLPHVYSADLVAYGKPAPDLFLCAAAKLGVDPARCIVIEDSVNGVIAGRAANMLSIGFVGGGHADMQHAERLMNAGAQCCVTQHYEILDWVGSSRLCG